LSASAESILSSNKKQRTPKHSSRISPSASEKDNTKLLQLAEQVAHFGSWEWDTTKPRAAWSRELFHIFGLEPQAEGLTLDEFRSFIHPDDLKEVTERMQTVFIAPKLDQKTELDYRIIRTDGSVRIIHSQRQVKQLTEDGKLKVIVGVDQDVTEQRRFEQTLAENAKQLQLAEQVAGFGSWQLDTSQQRAVWSPGMFTIFGVTPGTTLGLDWEEYLSFIHPEDIPKAQENVQIMLNSPLNHKEVFDYRIIRRDGQTRILHAQRQVAEVTADGKTKVIVGVDQDVTEQKQAEEALKLSEERFRIVAEVANVMVYEIDFQNQKIHFVHGMEKLLGYKPHEIERTVKWSFGIVHPDDFPKAMATLNSVLKDPTKDKYSMEYRVRRKKGDYITVKDTARAIKNAEGKTLRFIGGMRDITQRTRDRQKIEQYNKHLQELVEERTKQLINLERLAAIGEVAGMVGHDIRNPLQALTGEVYLIRTDLDSITDAEAKQDITESLDSVDEEINYINKIVADLQDYSRKLTPETTQLDLNQQLSELKKALSIPQKINLTLNIPPQTRLTADPTFLRRALTNLINNAVQAMPDGGDLTINAAQEDSTTCITIQDTGVGIPPEVQAKLFTPMFTTKAKGQGLGLAVVKRLIEAQGGTITFQSQVGRGTTFTIQLPTRAGA
jgi:PAS domain S-box-containing protein